MQYRIGRLYKVCTQVIFGVSLLAGIDPVLAEGDPVAGKEKSIQCISCHGAEGISKDPRWPNLAGQKQAYLEKQLRDFASGMRKDFMMQSIAKPLSKQDIQDISAYYAQLVPK